MSNGWLTRLAAACRWGAGLVVVIGYALLSHLMASSARPSVAGALVATGPLLGLSLLMAWRATRRTQWLLLWLAGCAILYGLKGWLVAHYRWVFLLEHAGTYTLLCASFGLTLRAGETPMVSRFAGIVHGTLTPAITRYTRSVTWIWTLYFGGLAGLSLLLFWLAPLPVWSAFAYLLGLPLLVLMFAGEYAARCCLLPASDRAGPLQAIRAYRQVTRKPAQPPPAA